MILPWVYLGYMFISFYLLLLFLILYFRNRDTFFEIPKLTKKYSVSFLVPAYNEEKTITETIKHLFEIDYDNIVEVIAINDGSTDNTLQILKALKKAYPKLKILNKQNSGKADSLNVALKFALGELVIVVDADSYPHKDALSKLIGFFDNPKTGVATATAVPRNNNTLLENLQAMEYRVIAFTRKLLGYIDSIYVAPGTLAIYRKKALLDIGGFDKTQMTEDVEITWRLIKHGWKVKMCLDAYVTTTVPNKIKAWYRQRRRWSVGGLQCLVKYRKNFLKDGMLGLFIIPFFALGFFLGVVGLGILIYLSGLRIIRNYLFTKYSLEVGVPVLTLNNLYFTPTVLNYFGFLLFFLFLIFNLFVFSIMKDVYFKKQSFFNLLFFMVVYIMIRPILTVVSIYNLFIGRRVWR